MHILGQQGQGIAKLGLNKESHVLDSHDIVREDKLEVHNEASSQDRGHLYPIAKENAGAVAMAKTPPPPMPPSNGGSKACLEAMGAAKEPSSPSRVPGPTR